MGSCLTSLLLDVDFDISVWSLLHMSKRQTQEPQRECERGGAKVKYAIGIIRSKQLGQVSRKLNPNTARHFGQAPSWLAFCICLQSINTQALALHRLLFPRKIHLQLSAPGEHRLRAVKMVRLSCAGSSLLALPASLRGLVRIRITSIRCYSSTGS